MAAPTTHEEAVAKVRDLIKGIDIGMLTTINDEGHLHSRPMRTQEAEFDGTVWFFTKAESGKTHDLETNTQVNVAYARNNSQDYVSLAGTAELVRDRRKIEELWNPLYKAWFPDGLDDPELALIKVTAQSAEYWDSPSNVVVHIAGFLKAVTTGKQLNVGDNQRVEL